MRHTQAEAARGAHAIKEDEEVIAPGVKIATDEQHVAPHQSACKDGDSFVPLDRLGSNTSMEALSEGRGSSEDDTLEHPESQGRPSHLDVGHEAALEAAAETEEVGKSFTCSALS